MQRNFKEWLAKLRPNIADYAYYVDFPKIFRNVDAVKVELNILNSLVGSKNIEAEFETLVSKYPETLKCIPILMAIRSLEIPIVEKDGTFCFDFREPNYPIDRYKKFMRQTGLFNLLENRIVNNLVDYVTGAETGLDSNARKNRGGHLMENLVEGHLAEAGFEKGKNLYKEMYIHEIQDKWAVDLSAISNNGKSEKRFDFVVKTPNMIYGIETNFYKSGGSKLNETARSYKTIALETKDMDYFTFVWFTDGQGWLSAKNNLEETFDIHEHVYNIQDLENGVIDRIMK